MKIKISTLPAEQIETEALILTVFEDQKLDHPVLRKLDTLSQGLLTSLVENAELKGKATECHYLYRPAGLRVQKLLVVGGGKKSEWNYASLRRLAGSAWRALNVRRVRQAVLWLPVVDDLETACRVVAEGLVGASFEPDTFKSTDHQEQRLQDITILIPNRNAERIAGKACLQGMQIGAAFNFSRSLINEPANCLPPAILAQKAKKMAGRYGLRCMVLNEKDMAAKGMHCLLSVSKGSTQPPRLILLEYQPPKQKAQTDLIALVGKGITFDSGGISLKPSEGMEEMKADMSGAAVVIGVMQAIAELKPACRVLGVAPCVENMPGGSATRPGDVVRAMNGKSVEIINTDAEGRLVLADALCYVATRKPAVMIDIATLTGACKVALGTVYAGLFASEDRLADQLLGMGALTGEKLWRLPLDAEYARFLQSEIADLRNVGNRWGGAIYGAMFLQNFVSPTPWAHLDIAGVDWLTEAVPHQAKGPTGFGFRTLVEFVQGYQKRR